MPGLQAPLVPTRSGNSTPTPSASSTGASTPTLAGSSQPSPPVTLLNSPPAHNRVPSTTSSDDFGDFVASDPLHPSASTPPSTGATAGQAADLLQFSPVRETFLDGAARRVEERQKDLLGPLALLDAINRPGFDGLEQGFGGGERTAPVPVGGSHRRIPSNSGGTRPILSPPRRFSHIMSSSPPNTGLSSTNSQRNVFSTFSDEPSAAMTPSTAEIYHPTFEHKETSADFFTEGIRRVSLDSTSAALPPTRSRTHTPSGSSSTPTPIDSPVGRKPTSRTPSPGMASSPHSTTGPASLPSLLKTKSKWTSLLSSHSSSTSASVDPEVTLTHTTPFHSHLSTSGAYVPPSGAPGFKPTQGPERDGAQWDDLDEKGVELVGRRESTIGILSSNAAEMIRPHLPPRPRLADKWTLLYSLDQHGSSLGTFYAQNEKWDVKHKQGANSGVVLCVRDSEGGMFGGWVNETFKARHGSYYGSGECFLYKFHPFRSTTPLPSSASSIGGIEVFPATFQNSYFVLSTPDFLSLGGGNGKYGLYLDRELMKGTTARCPCFDNEILCAGAEGGNGDRTEKFEVVGVEVWGVGD